MKKLLKYFVTDSIQSFIPVLMWALLPLIFRNTIWAEGYITTYPYQFLYELLYHLIFKSQLKHEKCKHEENNNYALTGIILLSIASILIYVASILNWESIKYILGFSEAHKSVFVFSLGNLIIDWILMAIIVVYQYNDENKQAFKITIAYCISKSVLVCLAAKYNMDVNIIVLVYAVILAIAILSKMKGYKFKFSINAFKYSISPVSSSFCMMIVYILGISKMTNHSLEVLSAYNLMSMCCDTQWDAYSSSVDTNTTLHITSGKFEEQRRKLFIDAILHGILMIVLSASCVFICMTLPIYRDSINFKYVWIMFSLECLTFPLYGIQYTARSWTAVSHPNPFQALSNIIKYIIRTLVTLTLPTIYAVSEAVISSCIIGLIFEVCIYKYYRKRDLIKC